MSAESVVLAGRQFAEQQMTSTCAVASGDVAPVWNEATGAYDVAGVTVYSGPCKVKFPSAVVRETDMQAQFGVEQEPVLHLPVDGSELVQVGDVVTILSNPLDAAMVGMRLRIAGVHTQTYATARRFPCEVVTGG